MKSTRAISYLVCIAILISAFTGCEKKQASDKNSDGVTELTYFASFTPNGQAGLTTRADTEFYKAIEKELNIKIKFTHPVSGQETEQFGLMLASKSIPDIIEWDWLSSYPGGVEKAFSDKKIIALNDIIDNGKAPNLKKYLEEKPELAKMVKTDDGKYYAFPFLKDDPILSTNFGISIRQDWLTELGLSVPETIDEWHNVLTEFKNKKGAASPLIFSKNNIGDHSDSFIGAFGVPRKFYLEDGKVKYGSIQPEFKKFLETFSTWLSEGLIDKDFAVVDRKTYDARILNNEVGAFLGFAGSHLGSYLDSAFGKGTAFDLTAAPYPVMNKGDRPQLGNYINPYMGFGSAAISTACKNVDIAAKLLDFGYGEKGRLMFNFGIEGESYTMVDGSPKFTDVILKNPDGLNTSQAMTKYMRAHENAPMVQLKEYIYQYYKYDQQKKALEVWSDTDAKNYMLPPLTPTAEESTRYASIMSDVLTYTDEMFDKFVMGVEPVSGYDSYVEQVKKFGIDEAISILQNAYDRYKER